MLLLGNHTDNRLKIGSIDAGYGCLLTGDGKGNFEYIIDLAMDLSSEGYEAIYINVDNMNGDELLLSKVVNFAQGYLKEPFILETQDSNALENHNISNDNVTYA